MSYSPNADRPQGKRFKPSNKGDTKYKTVCKYWLEGTCGKGDECTFLHEGEPKTQNTEVCKYFLTGTCLKGKKCPYSHDTQLVPCKFYNARGFCNQGKLCKYSHKPIDKDAKNKIKKDYEAYQKYEKRAAQQTSALSESSVEAYKDATFVSTEERKPAIKPELRLRIYQLPPIFENVSEEEQRWIDEAVRKYKPYSSPF